MARPGLRQHPKFRRLVHTLQEPAPHVLGYLEFIWSVGYEAGNPLLGDAVDVELAAEYPGTRGKLCKALLDVRLIDQLGDGRYAIHDLMDHAPDYVRRRMEREAERAAKGKTLSDVRRAAAGVRWHPGGATTMQTDANDGQLHPLADCRDASGATPAPAPAPSGGRIPQTPSCSPEGERGQVKSPPGKKKGARRGPAEGFDEFWAAWPKKVAKAEAVKAWDKLAPDPQLRATILAALERQARARKVLGERGEFVPNIPYPATWLNGRRWDDEVQEAGSSQPPGETAEQRRQRVADHRAATAAQYDIPTPGVNGASGGAHGH
jgi:hypothetical protein